jgi:hypothetical protein
MVMFTIAVLAVFLGIAVDFTANTGRMSQRGQDFTGASALANGALDAAYIKWNEYMSANQASNVQLYTTTANFQALASATLTAVNNAASANLSPYKVVSLSINSLDRTDSLIATGGGTGYVNGSGAQYSYLNGSTVVTSGSTAPMANVPGWTATTYTYRATAMVTKNSDPSLVTSVSRYFQQADASLFQAMLFFQNDLELHPGAPMTLFGLVHTNANFYAATSASLTRRRPTTRTKILMDTQKASPRPFSTRRPVPGMASTRPCTRPAATVNSPMCRSFTRLAPMIRRRSIQTIPTPPGRTRSSSGQRRSVRPTPARTPVTPTPTLSRRIAFGTALVCASSSTAIAPNPCTYTNRARLTVR